MDPPDTKSILWSSECSLLEGLSDSAPMPKVTTELYETVAAWENRATTVDHFPYRALLDEVLFHADLRFEDYIQYRGDGAFSVRLKHWLSNVESERQKQALFKILRYLHFIDRQQMLSLHRDAYRRIICPWLTLGRLSTADYVAPDYDARLVELFGQCSILSITQSFGFQDFLHVNDLSGLPTPIVLGEDGIRVASLRGKSLRGKGFVVLEDFVGSGKQAATVISQLLHVTNRTYPILFVPFIVLEAGVRMLQKRFHRSRVSIQPVLLINAKQCLSSKPNRLEPSDFPALRSVVSATARRVMERLDARDDPPRDPFGYGGVGALVVTHHNAPNNTLPLIHHRAPDWNPLFRRIHHSKDGL
jgi:hypothetical protein